LFELKDEEINEEEKKKAKVEAEIKSMNQLCEQIGNILKQPKSKNNSDKANNKNSKFVKQRGKNLSMDMDMGYNTNYLAKKQIQQNQQHQTPNGKINTNSNSNSNSNSNKANLNPNLGKINNTVNNYINKKMINENISSFRNKLISNSDNKNYKNYKNGKNAFSNNKNNLLESNSGVKESETSKQFSTITNNNNNSLINQHDENSKSKNSVNEMKKRMQKIQEEKKKKIDKIKNKKEEEVSFKPNINPTSRQLFTSTEDFLTRQKKFSEQIEEKKRKLQEKEEEKKIKLETEISEKIAEKHHKQFDPVHFEQKVNDMISWEKSRVERITQKQIEDSKKEFKECTFKPKINKQSAMIVSSKKSMMDSPDAIKRLYNVDLEKRKKKNELLQDIYAPTFNPVCKSNFKTNHPNVNTEVNAAQSERGPKINTLSIEYKTHNENNIIEDMLKERFKLMRKRNLDD